MMQPLFVLGLGMWSVKGLQVVHSSGLAIEVIDGSFKNPMNLAVKGDEGLSAPQLAMMIREGIDFAISHQRPDAHVKSKGIPVPANKPKRPLLKLKK